MEKEKKQSKKKAIITLSSVALFFAIMIGVLAVNWTNKTVTQEEVVEEVWASNVTVADADEFKRALEADAEIKITLSEDIVVREPLIVKGKKHLCGDGSIAMAMDVDADQNILEVKSGAELIYDGITVDGNSIASGVRIESGAKLDFVSGTIMYTQACGLDIEGDATIRGGKITECIHSGVYVGATGNVDMTAGEIVTNGQFAVNVASGGYIKLSENAVVQDATGILLQVTGTCDVIGIPLKDAGIYLVNANGGTINISQKEGVSEKLELCNSGKWGLQVSKDGQLNVENVYLHDVGRNAIHLSFGAGALNVNNCKISGTEQYGIVFRKTWDAAVVKNVEITDVEKYNGMVTVAEAVVDLENITFSNIGDRAICNNGGYVTAKNIKIENAANWGVTSSKSGESVGELDIDGLVVNGTKQRNAVNCNGSVVKIKNATINNPKQMGFRVHGNGKMTITNAVVKNPELYGMHAEKGSINFSNVKIYNAGARGVAAVEGTVTGSNLLIDTTRKEHGVTASKNGKLNITGLTLKNVGVEKSGNGFNIVSGGVANITDATVTNVKNIGARVNSGTLNMKNVQLSDMGDRGIQNEGGTVNLEKIVVNNAGTYGVTSSAVKEVKGLMTIKDLTINKTGNNNGINCAGSVIKASDVTMSDIGKIGVRIHKAGTVEIENVNIKNTKHAGIYSEGLAAIKASNVKIEDVGTRGIMAVNGTVNATNVSIDKTYEHGVSSSEAGVVNITGLTLKNVGTGDINANGFNAVSNSKMNITDAKIANVKTIGARAASGATFNMTDASLKDTGDRGIMGEAATITLNNIKVKNAGTYGITSSAVEAEDGTVTVGSVTMSNVNIENVAVNSAINCAGSYVKADSVTMSGIALHGVRVHKGGTVDISDVIIDSPGQAGIYSEGDSNVTANTVVVTNAGTRGMNVQGGVAKVTDLQIDTTTQHAIACSVAADVEINGLTVANVPTDMNGINAVDGSVVSVNGGTIEKIDNYGVRAARGTTITLTDVDLKETTKSAAYVEDATSTVNLNHVTINTTKSHGVECQAGNMVINGLTIADIKLYAVYAYNAGAIECNGTEINGVFQRGIFATTEGSSITGEGVIITAPIEHGIAASANGAVSLANVTITDVQKGNGINAVSNSQVTIKGGSINGAKTYGARVNGGATLTLDNVDITKAGTNALIAGASSTLNLKGDSVIDGENAAICAVDVAGTFNMEGGTIKNFVTTSSAGAGVYLQGTGTFIMKDGTIENCTAKGGGAAIFSKAAGAQAEMQGGTIKNCKVTNGNGGAVYVLAGTSFTMSGGTIDGCTASGVGGGIHGETNGTIKVTGGTVKNCSATSGGGIRIITGEINGGTIDTCSATTGYGGGILFDGANPNVSMKNGTIQNCSAVCGGAIGISFNADKEVVFSGGLIQNCTATNGGAVGYEQKGTFNMQGGAIKNCSTSNLGYGGAAYVDTIGTFKMNGGEISGNTAYQGGAIYAKTDIVMNGGIMKENKVNNLGGALRLEAGVDFTMNDGQIIDNQLLNYYINKDGVQKPNASYGAAIHGAGNNQIELLKGTMSGHTSTGADTYGDKNAIQLSACATTTQVTIGAEFVMGENSIRFSGLSSRTTPIVKITGTPITAEHPLYIAVSTNQEKFIQVGCDSADAAAAMLLNVKSADNKTTFAISGSNIVGAKK